MSIILRPYQSQGIVDLKKALRVHRRALLRVPTGGGKTVIAATIMEGAARKGSQSWFMVHRRELVEQTSRTLEKVGVDHGFVSAGFPPQYKKRVLLCSVQTIGRRLERVPKPDVIIWDECVTGDTIVETDVGAIAIKDVPSAGATLIKSWNGERVVWKRITAWRRTPRKKVLSLHFDNGLTVKGSANHPIHATEGWKPIGEIAIGESVLCSPQMSDTSSLVRCSETVQSYIRTSAQSRRVSTGRTQPHKQTGLSINAGSFDGSTRRSPSLEMLVTDLNQFAALPRAFQPSEMFLASFDPMENLNRYLVIGSMVSDLQGSPGGIAMMDPFTSLPDGVSSTLKGSPPKRMRSSANGWRLVTEMPDSTGTKGVTYICDSQNMLPDPFSKTFENMFPDACGTNWARVVNVSCYDEEPLYDLSVEETECFFANGILVHNCHHCAAGTYKKIAEAFPDALHIGLSATPERLDGKPLSDLFPVMVEGPSTEWLIENDFLCPYRVWTQDRVDFNGMKTRGHDFDAQTVGAEIGKSKIVGDAVEHYKQICPGQSAVAFCVDIERSLETRDAFRAAGVAAEHLDGSDTIAHRKAVLKAFRDGKIKVLTSVDLFGEGFDLPELRAVIMLRPTQSVGLYLQQVGRALRTAPGKDVAYILDHVGNVNRHGLPDAPREWSLEGRKKRARAGDDPTKQCFECFARVSIHYKKCPHCGSEFTLGASGKPIEVEQGELIELEIQALKQEKRDEVRRARTREELQAIARARGYKPGWVDMTLKARQGRAA